MLKWLHSRPTLSKILGIMVGIVAGFVTVVLVMNFKPFSLDETFTPDPASSYAEAAARIQSIQVGEADLDLYPECSTRLLTHGSKTDAVIVFLHGFTSCPEQFAALGQEYFDLGYNVYIPRAPRHGFNDRSGKPLEGLTAEEMAGFAQQTADIAQGLGERVIVSGLSGGGTMTAYLAQERADVDVAAPISPFMGIKFIPRPLNMAFTNLILALPNIWQWWDPIKKANNPLSAPYSYARYPMHALAENMRLGFVTLADAKEVRPQAGDIIVITNASDESVNVGVIKDLEQTWLQHGDETLATYRFEKALELPHDLITIVRPGARTDLVYPKLVELIQ